MVKMVVDKKFDVEKSSFSVTPFFKNKLLVGLDSTSKVGKEASRRGAENVLIVTDEEIEKAGLLDKVESSLEKSEITWDVYNDVEPEPSMEDFKDVKNELEESYDMIIGIGGGSVLDTAKIASILSTNDKSVEDYVGMNRVEEPALPKILIPTTAGTGAEVSNIIVVTVGEYKNFIIDDENVPEVAIIDPTLHLTLPPKVTAHTAIDALTHAVESFTSRNSNYFSDAIAYKAIELIASNAKIAYMQGGNVNARYNMAVASTLAGMAMVNAFLGLPHAIGQTISKKLKIPHGLSCGIPLPYSMRYNLPVTVDKTAKIGKAFGIRNDISKKETAKKAVEKVSGLLSDLNIPLSLEEAGAKEINEEDLSKIAEDIISGKSNQQLNLRGNPRNISKSTLQDLLLEMKEGEFLR